MDPLSIIGLISTAINAAVKLGPTVLQTVEDASPFAEAIFDMFGGTPVSDEDGAEFERKIAVLSARLQNPLPPATSEDV